MVLTQSQQKASGIITSCAGCLSFASSVTMIIMILRSRVKLSSAYRRLIFGLVIFDMFKSLSSILSSFAMPTGLSWGAIGNDATCTLQGFFAHIGLIGSCFYSLSLSICFLAVIIYKRPGKNTMRLEIALHIFTILLANVSGIILVFTDNFGPSGVQCWLAPKPLNCGTLSNALCTTYGDPELIRWLFGAFPVHFVFVMNCSILFFIGRIQQKQARKNLRYRRGWMTLKSLESQSTTIENANRSGRDQTQLNNLAGILSNISGAEEKRLRHIRNQTYAFALGFFFTYFFAAVYRYAEMYGKSEPPFVLVLLSRMTSPLHGFVNMIIYTYPYAQSYRLNHSSHNFILCWIWAFWHVVKNGGDNDKQISRRLSQRTCENK